MIFHLQSDATAIKMVVVTAVPGDLLPLGCCYESPVQAGCSSGPPPGSLLEETNHENVD